MSQLEDPLGRRFRYLRLSVTDRCNFRCAYCLPDGYQKPKGMIEPELELSEIRLLVEAFAELGITKVRLTGGEPTLRRDFLEIARCVSSVPGIEKLAISTNGHSLRRSAAEYGSAGIQAVNLSLDSMEPGRFREITGSSRHSEILGGVDAALEAGIASVKVNCVLMKDWNDGDIPAFMDWVRRRPVSVRFIELMQTGAIGDLFEARHLRSTIVQRRLIESGWVPCQRGADDGPAVEYRHADFLGRIGIIAPYSSDFCASCNRLRISSRGRLQLCLFGAGGLDLRTWLSSAVDREGLKSAVREALSAKKPAHALHEAEAGDTSNLSMIGG